MASGGEVEFPRARHRKETNCALARWRYMLKKIEERRARAERFFDVREELKADAPKAAADYYAAEQRIRDRTMELRHQRLAREAAKQAAG